MSYRTPSAKTLDYRCCTPHFWESVTTFLRTDHRIVRYNNCGPTTILVRDRRLEATFLCKTWNLCDIKAGILHPEQPVMKPSFCNPYKCRINGDFSYWRIYDPLHRISVSPYEAIPENTLPLVSYCSISFVVAFCFDIARSISADFTEVIQIKTESAGAGLTGFIVSANVQPY